MRMYFLPVLPLLIAATGCDDTSIPETAEPKPIAIGANFTPAETGVIYGRVVWDGPIPTIPPINAMAPLAGGGFETRSIPNPNAPQIDPETRSVAGSVIFLEQIGPHQARPWDLPPVRVEIHDNDIRIVQGDKAQPVGFVRQGDEIEMVSRSSVMQSLSVRGANFFTLAFPDPEQPLRRRLGQSGLVELSSGMGRYWQHAYLFVAQHSYFTCTDQAGKFTLTNVPAGDLRVVCWLPNGKVARTERDPNTIGILRMVYEKPLERTNPIRLVAGEEKHIEFKLKQSP
jgi:hypothetical protein